MTKLKNYIYLILQTATVQFTTLLAFIEMRFHTPKKNIFQYKPSGVQSRPTTKFNEILY